MPSIRVHHGFTIIELLVAVSITAILLFLINQIYNEAVGATRRGVQTADVIASHRGLADQIERDFENQVPPGDANAPGGGYLAIFNKEIDDVRMPDPSGSSGFTAEDLRADQMMFVRYSARDSDLDVPLGSIGTGGEELLEASAPSNSTTFTPPRSARADYARVWYGHLDYTLENGVPVPSTQTLANASGGGASGFMNNGWNWMVGRQALLLVGPYYRSSSSGNWTANNGSGFAIAGGVFPDSGISGYGTISDLPNPEEELATGYVDITRYGLHSDQVWAQGTSNEVSRTAGNIDGDVIIGLDSSDSPFDFILTTGQAHTGTDSYQDRIYAMSFAGERLAGNPKPVFDLASWQVGQMHPIAMMNVSDIIIEFAADAVDDSGISSTNHPPDGRPDVDVNGRIIWYGLGNPPPWDSSAFPDESGPPLNGVSFPNPNDTPAGLANADAAFVWRHDYRYNWPYLIRIRYRAHDTRGDLTSTVWGGDDGKDNDRDNNVDEADEARDFPINGKWFEVIVKVDRGGP